MEAELLVALEQLEAVEAALLTHPADADLLRAKAELTELLTLSSLLHAPPTTNPIVDAGAEDGGAGDKGVADMFGGDDDEWERTHEREFALHTERQKQAFITASSSSSSSTFTPASSSTTSSSSSSSSSSFTTVKRSEGGDEVEGEQAGWLACRVVVTESFGGGGGGFGGPRQRRVWREGLLHSRAPDEAGRYRVTLLHSRLAHEVRAEDVLLQGATLKHLNHHATAGDDGQDHTRTRKRRRRESEEDDDDDESSDDGFEGFSLMRATGGHDYVVGAWESHTSGIGSRLLAKMGYTPGKGLGRGGEGIVKPLGIGLKAPSRKKELLGLGHDERAGKRGEADDNNDGDDHGRSQAFDEAGNPIPRKRRRGGKKSRNKKAAAAARDDEGETTTKKKTSDVFGFLNEIGQVGGTAKTGGGGGGGGEDRQKREKAKREDGYKKMSAQELQDSLKKKIIEKDDVSAKIKQLEESVHRNKDRDPAMAAQAKQRMREARTRLHTLHAEIKELATRVKIKEGTRKTIVF